MTRNVRSSFVLLLFILSSVLIFAAATVLALDHDIPAIVPAPQTADWWMPQHERNVARVRQGSVDLLMIGDSITQGWRSEGRRVWERFYTRRRAVNLGFSSDRTEQVLWWRLLGPAAASCARRAWRHDHGLH